MFHRRKKLNILLSLLIVLQYKFNLLGLFRSLKLLGVFFLGYTLLISIQVQLLDNFCHPFHHHLTKQKKISAHGAFLELSYVKYAKNQKIEKLNNFKTLWEQ